MNLVYDHSSIAHLHTIRIRRSDRNGKCLIFLAVLLSANLLLVESFQFFRFPKALYVYKTSSDHFVVETQTTRKMFSVYWNSPTSQCKKHGIKFDDLTKLYGIRQNRGDSFRGNQISILYDPGNFPALLEDPSSNELKRRNGGVPQEGNLEKHLTVFKEQLEDLIPDGGFNGIGVIDFESWRPIFRQNFGSLVPYKDLSYDLEKKLHPDWTKNDIEKEAARRFEEAGAPYMRETLLAAKQARPLAKWGYYAYPYCFNMNVNTKNPNCADGVMEENNRIQWLWDESDLLFPSMYLNKNKLNADERLLLIKGRVAEAKRLSAKTSSKPGIYPYLWYKYQDETETFLTKEDLLNAFKHMSEEGLDGVIIWGSSNDVNTKENCQKVRDYVDNVLGPIARTFIPKGTHRSTSESMDLEEPTE